MILFNILLTTTVLFTKVLRADSNRFEELSNLVQDVIENEGVPSILWAKTCWPKTEEFKFIKKIPFQMKITNLNEPINLVFNDNTNKEWFFLDAICEKQLNILSDVDVKYFSHPYRWIIADATNSSIQDLSFFPGSNIILANRDIKLKQYILKQGHDQCKHFILK